MILLMIWSMVLGRQINPHCLCGHVDDKEQCSQSEVCQWSGMSCILKNGKSYIQEISDSSDTQCYRYAQEDCIKLEQCGFYLGECIPFIDCSVFQKQECQESSLKCVSDGSKCIQRQECSDYLTEIGCQYKNIHEQYCYWNTNSCQLAETCSQLPLHLTSDALCRAAIPQCTVSDLGFGCQDGMILCSKYKFENQCFTNQQGLKCFWQDEKCYEKICTNKKLKTDDECKLFDNQCTSNGINCVIRKQCSDANQYGCVTDLEGHKCVYQQSCIRKSCSTAPITYNNYQLCQLYDPDLDCVISGSGGCKERPIDCIGYEGEADCHSKQDCVWFANACAKRQCFHAPLPYTHVQCKAYGQCMGKSGGGCQQLVTCTSILEQQFCEIDVNGNNCVWENGQCQDLICSNLRLPNYDSHAKCFAASKYCTFNIEIGGCVDYKCANVIELDACTIDSDGNQCKIYDGCILKRCKLAPSSYVSNLECESWDSTCTVNVYQFSTFILLFGCTNKVSQCEVAFQQQCYSTITGIQCKWDSVNSICIYKSCSDADPSLYFKGSTYKCENYLVNGSKCIQSDIGCIEWPNSCANMLNQDQCNLGMQDGTECSWNGSICQNKQCSDAQSYTDNISCNQWKSTCIYKPPLGCQDRPAIMSCSSAYGYMYDTHAKCQAWNPNCTVVYDIGCTIKSNNCTDYKSENQCKITLSGSYCYWDLGTESCQTSSCNLRVSGDLTHSDCEQFMPTCTINKALCNSCVNLSTCSSYTLQQQCIINDSQQPCLWDYTSNVCKDFSCNYNTTATTERECYNIKRSFACQLKYSNLGCQDRPSLCSQIQEEIICNKTITINFKKCFYFNNQCQIITERDCHQISKSTSNEECIYYNNQCMLQYSGKGCQSIKYCEQLTALNCNSSILTMNNKCIYYANNCISNTSCSNLYPSDSSCDGKKTSLREQCQYYYSSSSTTTICGSKQCSNKHSLQGNVLQNYYQCQKFSSICTYDLSTDLQTRGCTEIINCNDLTTQGIIDFKLCNNSMTYNHQKCGFNFITNVCENRVCEHLQSLNVGTLSNLICYEWNYDCAFNGIDCITINNNCSAITLVHQCLHFQCQWYNNTCINLFNCHINITANNNYECELISPLCKLDFMQSGCAYNQCSDIIDATTCNSSHTSDGLECYWTSSCIPKQCNQFMNQVACESRFGVISSQISSKCYWCSSLCSNNYTCDPTIQSTPIKHSDCNSNDVTKTIYFNKVPKCVSKSINCSDYTYPEACQTTISGQKCHWNTTTCDDFCLTSPGPYTHLNCYNFNHNCMAQLSTCQYLNCTSITSSIDCNRYVNQCFWQTSCIKIQGCITFTQLNCTQNEKLLPCYWDTINLQCKEKTCQNIQTIPSLTSCSSWLQNCKFDNNTCIEDCNSAGSNTHDSCESYYLSKNCTVKYSNRHCTDLPSTCESAHQSQCFIDVNKNKCYFKLNQCMTYTDCSILGNEFNSHDKCQQHDCTVNYNLNGCIQLTSCILYQRKEQCHIDDSGLECEWISTQCVLKKCETAQLMKYTSGSCQQYEPTCTVNTLFSTCTMAAEKCSEYDYHQCISDGQKNSLGIECFWKEDNDLCAEMICKNGPKLATSNKECFGFMKQCQKGGCRLKVCSDFQFSIDQDCAVVFKNNRCATNGYYCVDRNLCEDVYIEDGCTFDIYNRTCLWITTTEKCITKTCYTAPLNLITDNQCYEYLPQCTAKKGGGCMQRKECSDNLIKEACHRDQYGLGCIWDDYLQICVTDQCEGFCGDGVISGLEVCDDGNYLPYDGCYKCQIQCPLGCFECNGKICSSCDPKGWYLNGQICKTKCGDGIAVGKEYCDDGNDIEYDGCYNCQYSCDVNCLSCYQGECFECPYGFYENQSYCISKCGDGVFAIQVEECEDGNTQSKDGCSSECLIEKNWKCYTIDQLSVCQYNISPEFSLELMPYDHGQNQEIKLTFSEQVRLNSQDVSQDYFLQLIQAQVSSKDSTIQIIALESISYDLSNPVYLIRVSFTSSVVSPVLLVTINCQNLVNQQENPLIIIQQQIQLKDPFILSSTQKFVAANAALFNQYVIYSLISIGVISVLSGNLEILWNLIDLLQQLSYIKYLNIQFPENLAIYFEIFGLVTVQPFVDKINLNGRVEQLFSIQTPFLPASGKFQDFQINSYFGVNLQSFILVLAIGILNYFASYFLQLILTSIRYNNWPVTFDQQNRCILTQLIRIMYVVQKASKAYYQYFFYSGILRIYLSNFYDITFSATLQIVNFNTQNNLNTVNSYLALGLILGNIFTVLSFYQLLTQKVVLKKYEVLGDGLQKKNKWSKQYHVIQLFKKTIFITNLVILQSAPLIQPIISSFISGLFVVYVLKVQPFTNKFENYKLIITEILIAFNTVLFSVQEMLKLYSKLEMQSFLGWMNIAGFTVILLSTLIIDFYQQVAKYIRVLCYHLQNLMTQNQRPSTHVITFY